MFTLMVGLLAEAGYTYIYLSMFTLMVGLLAEAGYTYIYLSMFTLMVGLLAEAGGMTGRLGSSASLK